jgi:lipopolysaccharide biosynthesis regulator YciM
VYEALGEAYQVQGDVHESERWLRKAVDVDHAAVAVQEREQQSSSSAALLTYARFLAKNVRTSLLLLLLDLVM